MGPTINNPASRLPRVLVATTCCWFIAASASVNLSAGVLVVETSRPYRRGADVTTTTLRIEANRLSLDRNGPEGHETILFVAKPLTVRVVHHREKFYRELSEQSSKALRQGLQEARAAMRKRADDELKRLPPEQRKEVEASIQARLRASPETPPAAPPSAVEYTKVWSGERAGEWKCDRYEGRVDGEKVWDACVVSWTRAGVTREESALLLNAIETLESLHLLGGYSAADMKSGKDAKGSGYTGIAVQRVRLQADRPVQVFEVQRMERREFTGEDFAVPPGYQKRVVLMMSPGP